MEVVTTLGLVFREQSALSTPQSCQHYLAAEPPRSILPSPPGLGMHLHAALPLLAPASPVAS